MKLNRKLFFYSQLFIIASLPVHFLISSYAIIISIVLFLWCLADPEFRDEIWSNLKSNQTAVLFLTFFLIYPLSLLIHWNDYEDFSPGKTEIEKKLVYLIFPFIFANIVRYDSHRVKKLFGVFVFSVVASTFFALLIGLYFTLTTGSLYFFDETKGVVFNNFMYHRLGSYIGIHAVYLAEYSLFALTLVAYYLIKNFHSLPRKQKIKLGLIIIYLLLIIILLKSAAILIILLAITLVFTSNYLIKNHNTISVKLKGLISIFTLALVVALGLIAFNKIGSKASYFEYDLSEPGGGNWNSINLRLAKWNAATSAVADNWLIGVGPGNTETTMDNKYRELGFEYALQLHYNPHNQFLHTFLTVGIPGIVIFILLLISLFKESIIKKDILFFIFLISMGLFSISESVLAVNKGIVFFTSFATIFSYLPKRLGDYLNE